MKPAMIRYEGAPKSFRIRADNMPAAGLEINESLGTSYVTKLIEEPSQALSWKSLGDASFECRLEHEADMLHLRGRGTFSLVYPCVRCMEDVEFKTAIALDVRMLPREKDPDQGQTEFESEAFDESQSDELVVSYYDDGIIDLSEVLREQLFLELPQYPSCESVGALNPKACDLTAMEATNSVAATVIEHPFARLANWKAEIVN